MNLREQLQSFEPPFLRNAGPAISEWESAAGCYVSDGTRRYLDFTSGLMMANCGHNDVGSTLMLHGRTAAWYAPTRARLRAYEALRSILPDYLDRYVLNVTGGEAVETALRIAASYLGAPIESFARATAPTYHGNHDILSRMTTGLPSQSRFLREGMEVHPLCQAILLCPFEGPTCRWWSESFMTEIRGWQESGGLLIVDECQGGMGRTGRWFGFQHYDIEPDLVVLGKSLGNGWPISAVAGRHEIMDGLRGDYISTYSGQPHCCNALTDTVDYIRSRDLIANASAMGGLIEAWARATGYHQQGRGLAQAIIVGKQSREIIAKCLADGLILMDTSAVGTIKIAPPLCISTEDLLSGLGIIDNAIREIAPGVAGMLQAE